MENTRKQFDPWSQAPVGALIETRMNIHPDYPVVRGIRSEVGSKAYVLVLGGDPHVPVGCLLAADLANNETVDISEQYKVEATNQRSITEMQPKIGMTHHRYATRPRDGDACTVCEE